MTSAQTTALRQVLVSVIMRGAAGSGADPAAVAAAARRAYQDLAVVLAPLISPAGVDALLARALQLAQREFPSDFAGDDQAAEPLGHISLWLERQDSAMATDAAAAMFVEFAGLLATLIGEPLTTRYLRRAWPDGFSATTAKGTSA